MFARERAWKPPVPTTKHQIHVDGHYIQYQVAGEGEPLVLVHGLSGSGYWWIRNVAALARHYKVYLIDLPGFGAMRRERRRFMLAQSATWLLHWMQAIGLERAHFMGHSMGGFICVWLAAEHPEVVSRLILVAPALLPQNRTVFDYVFPLVSGVRYATPIFLPLLAYDALRAGPITLLRAAMELFTQDIRDKVKQIHVPTLLIWGEKDTLVPSSLGRVLCEEMPQAELFVLKRAGHVCMFDRAAAFNERVLSFLLAEAVQ